MPSEKIIQTKNEQTYDKYWSRLKIRDYTDYPEWQVLRQYVSNRIEMLEIGPGSRPKLPVKGSHFIEISQVAVDALSALGGIAIKGPVTRFPFKNSYFGLICAFEALEHIPNDEEFIREIARVLSPSGHFIFSVPLHQKLFGVHDKAAGHVRRYDPEDLQIKLRRAGLKITGLSKHGLHPNSRLVDAVSAFFLNRHPRLGIKISDFFYPIALSISRKEIKVETTEIAERMDRMYGALFVSGKAVS